MLAAEHLTKRYANVAALDDLTLTIPEGAIYGLLGPNGAGKTTLLRIAMGLVPQTSGTIRLFDSYDPSDRAVRQLLGYMPQRLAIYPGLSVQENVHFFGHLYGVEDPILSERTGEILELVELRKRAGDLVGNLSGGMIRRTMLATALVHHPRLLILDEPTAGVDPILRVRFWEWFERLVEQGTSIIVTTHHIADAKRCGQIVFLRDGRMIETGTPAELMQRYDAEDLEQAFVGAAEAAA